MNFKEYYINGFFPTVRFNLYGMWNNLMLRLYYESLRPVPTKYHFPEWLDFQPLINGQTQIWFYNPEQDIIETQII